MCLVCGVYCFRKRQLKEDPNWRMPLPHSRSGSRTTLKNLNSDMGSEMDDDNSIKKTGRYDGTYRTNEPLAGKPNIEFLPKKMDLEDEDVTSSEGGGSEYNKDKIARDIEYTNFTDDRPKQLGRRQQRQGDYTPIEEEENLNYPPPPLDSPTQPYSPGTYSPTFSGLDRDRDSFMTDTLSQRPNNAIRVLPQSTDSYYGGPSGSTPQYDRDIGLPVVNNNLNSNKSTEV